jgi:hypothetical protein
MRADDDGFVNNPKKIQRMIGCSDDDFKILLAKNFIIQFEDGVCVIKHWRVHNYIQNDRKKDTNYLEHMAKLSIKDNNVYTMDTNCIHDVSKMETQVSIGKVSLVEVSIVEDINNIPRKNALDDGFDLFWKVYPKKIGKKQALKAWKKEKPPLDAVLLALQWQTKTPQWNKDNGQYVINPTSYINQARWEDEQPEERAPF